MPAPKKPAASKSKLKDLKARTVSGAKARKVSGGATARDPASGLATGKRMHKPL